MTTPLLTIAISTTLKRLSAVDWGDYPRDSLWKYDLLVQMEGDQVDLRRLPERDDLRIHLLQGTGLAGSRNIALKMCDTDFLLFADDDIQIVAEGVRLLVQNFASNPTLSLAAGMTCDFRGRPLKRYASTEHALTPFNSGKIGSVELAIRPQNLREAKVAFDCRFGLGSSLPLGEEYVLIADALAAGLKGMFFPVELCRHAATSTGTNWGSREITEARAAVLDRVFGWKAPAAKLVYVAKHFRDFPSIGSYLRFAHNFLAARELKACIQPETKLLRSVESEKRPKS